MNTEVLFKQGVSLLLLPPGLMFLGFALGMLLLGVGYVKRRRSFKRAGWSVVALAVITLWAASTNATAIYAQRWLEHGQVPWNANTALPAQAIVIVGSGRTPDETSVAGVVLSDRGIERLRYGIALSRASGLPILFSGGAVEIQPRNNPAATEAALADAIARREFDMPLRWLESTSLNTQENALNSAAILRPAAPNGIKRIVLVTHGYHMLRARAWFVHAGFEVQPAPLLRTDDKKIILADWLPSRIGSRASKRVFRELTSLAWQRLRLALGIG
jgi:uncharacterized SAM-binding protein YcdF (DUF218 family)